MHPNPCWEQTSPWLPRGLCCIVTVRVSIFVLMQSRFFSASLSSTSARAKAAGLEKKRIYKYLVRLKGNLTDQVAP